MISSDYVPSSLLASAFALARLWAGDLPRPFATATDASARAEGPSDRGRIAVLLRADLIRLTDIAGHPVLRGVWSAGQRAA